MHWVPVLVLAVLNCTGSYSQSVPSQPPSASVSPGNTVKLSCSGISGYGVYWYQQKPGNPPRYLLYYSSDSSKHQGSGVPARFSGSKDASGNTCYLTIMGALAEDEADYYCVYWPGTAWIFGGGTQMTVTGQPASPPTVNLFPPSADEIQSKNKATVVCLMDSFTPGAITVTWQADGATITNGVETTKPTKVNDKYMAASYLSLDKAEWERRNSFTCKVTHEGSPYSKTINRSQCA